MYYRFIETMHDKASISIQRETIKEVLRAHYIHVLALSLIKNWTALTILSTNGVKKLLVLFASAAQIKILKPLASVLPKKILCLIGCHLNKVDAFILSFVETCDLRPCGPLYMNKDIRVNDLRLILELSEVYEELSVYQNSQKKGPDMSFQGLWRTHIILEVIEVKEMISDSFERSIQSVFYSGRAYALLLMGLFSYLSYGNGDKGLLILVGLVKIDLYCRLMKIVVGVLIHLYGKHHMARWKKVLMAMQRCMHGQNVGRNNTVKKLNMKIRRWESMTVALAHYFKKRKETIPVGHVYLSMGLLLLMGQVKHWL